MTIDIIDTVLVIFTTVTACLASYKIGIKHGEERAKQIITGILKEAERQSKLSALNSTKQAE